LVSNEGTVAAAIGSGRGAALQIHRALAGEELVPSEPRQVATPETMHWHVFTPAPAHHAERLPPDRRRRRFTEIRRGYDGAEGGAEALHEAGRCLSCGVCNECDRCVTHCPEGILLHDADGYRFDYDYCKGCGVCAAECPRGVIYLSEL
jgi:ferredoxin